MPSRSRPEDLFIEAFLSVYENLSWADAERDWVDRRQDAGVEMLATRRSDGKTLAIEHTLVQPFVEDVKDFKFFERSFLTIESDQSLVIPGRWIRVFVPIRTLDPFPKAGARGVVVGVVREWIRANRFQLQNGKHQYQCPVTGMQGVRDFEITLTVKAQDLPGPGHLQVRRQQVGNDFADVIGKALSSKLPKLVKQNADKRVLILERRHMNLEPEQILDEIRKQASQFPQLDDVDEIWLLETIGYKPGGYFQFERFNTENVLVANYTFHDGRAVPRKMVFRFVTVEEPLRNVRVAMLGCERSSSQRLGRRNGREPQGHLPQSWQKLLMCPSSTAGRNFMTTPVMRSSFHSISMGKITRPLL